MSTTCSTDWTHISRIATYDGTHTLHPSLYVTSVFRLRNSSPLQVFMLSNPKSVTCPEAENLEVRREARAYQQRNKRSNNSCTSCHWYCRCGARRCPPRIFKEISSQQSRNESFLGHAPRQLFGCAPGANGRHSWKRVGRGDDPGSHAA